MSRNRIEREIQACVANKTMEKLENDALLKGVDRLKDRVAVITGGGSGFGKLYCEAAGLKGAKLVIADINEEAAKKVAEDVRSKGGEATHFKCDVTSWDSQVAMFQHAVDTFGKVDVALANAGVSELGPGEFEDSELRPPTLKTLDINSIGACRIALHHMRQKPADYARNILITGSFASFFGAAVTVMYATSKHSILGLMRALTYVGAPHGINTNMLAPYFSDTPILGAFKDVLGAEHPLTKTEDVRDVMLSLSVEDKVRGAVYLVDPTGVFRSTPKLSPFEFPQLKI